MNSTMREFFNDSDSFNSPDPIDDGIGSQPSPTALAVYVIAVVGVGVAGNPLTIYTIASVRSLRTTSNILVTSLAVADLGTVAVGIPVVFSRYRFPAFHERNPFLCKVSYFLMIFFVAVSVNHLQVIAFNRYFIVTRNRYTYRKYWSRARTFLTMSAIWLYSVFLVCLPFLGFGEIEYIPELGGCGIVETTSLSWWYKTYLLLIVVESCGIVAPLFFVLTFRAIQTSKRRVESQRMTTDVVLASLHAKPRGFSRSEMAVTRMTVLVFLCFLICWCPYLVLHAVTGENQKPGDLAAYLLVFAYSSSAFDPFIYAGTNRNFRRAFFLGKMWTSQSVSTGVSTLSGTAAPSAM